ncbi:MAG: hypothetical protein RIB03_16070 [Henriciella sp.]|uniref:hypothetical protein n=1 Tax=Henriciella sp. TaxID=1968823 RepID=UPI0032EBED55
MTSDEVRELEDLTPVERGVLVALMAAGGLLKESAELGGRYQIRMTPAHRKKLAGLGLIKTTRNPFTHQLTDAGWAFLARDFPMDVPREPMKLGAMNALVEGVLKQAGGDPGALEAFFKGKSGQPKPSEPTQKEAKTPSAESDLSDAAWSDSEEALAMALQDMAAFGVRLQAVERSAGETQANPLKQLSLNADAIFQNVRLAARKRGLETDFERGEEIDFDPVYFDCFEELDEGEAAIVMKQPVIKHTARDQKIVVLRGLVSPAD